jgi:hypothetical protein
MCLACWPGRVLRNLAGQQVYTCLKFANNLLASFRACPDIQGCLRVDRMRMAGVLKLPAVAQTNGWRFLGFCSFIPACLHAISSL